MTESAVAIVRDESGAIHYAARSSEFVQKGLTDGSLIDMEAERENAANAQASDSEDTKSSRRRSGDRAGTQSNTDND